MYLKHVTFVLSAWHIFSSVFLSRSVVVFLRSALLRTTLAVGSISGSDSRLGVISHSLV